MVRVSGDTIAFSPPLIAEEAHIDEIFETFGRTLDKVA